MTSPVRPADNIFWARPLDKKPSFIPTSRPRGAKAAGVRYERKLAEYLKPLGCIHGQWFEFEDKSGVRYCQTDVLFPVSRRLLAVIEVKYTLVERAYDQLLDLYGPVVEAAYNIPVGLVVVYRNSRVYMPQKVPFVDLPMAAQFSQETGHVSLLHWMGQPLAPKPNDRLESILSRIDSKPASATNPPLGR